MFYMFEVQIPVDAYPVFGLKRRSFLFVIDKLDPVEPVMARLGYFFTIYTGSSLTNKTKRQHP